jgi:hypothetical protein
MILLDDSVLVDYLRSRDANLLALMQHQGAAICGVTRAEILHGARGGARRQQLLTILDALQQVEIPSALWDEVGDLLSKLRSVGLAIPFSDAVVATVAIALGIEVWARDQHFEHMRQRLPALKLFQEPP